jgi:hypothetical protein
VNIADLFDPPIDGDLTRLLRTSKPNQSDPSHSWDGV